MHRYDIKNRNGSLVFVRGIRVNPYANFSANLDPLTAKELIRYGVSVTPTTGAPAPVPAKKAEAASPATPIKAEAPEPAPEPEPEPEPEPAPEPEPGDVEETAEDPSANTEGVSEGAPSTEGSGKRRKKNRR